VSARYNQYLKTDKLADTSYWQQGGVTVADSSVIGPTGTVAQLMTETATTGTHRLSANNNSSITGLLSTGSYTNKCYFKAGTGAPFAALWIADGSGSNVMYAWFNLVTGVKGTSTTAGAAVISSYDMRPVQGYADWYECWLTGTTNGTGSIFAYVSMADVDGGFVYTGNTGRSIFINGADLRVANDGVGIPDYQRVNTATDYDTVGFPVYLRADGSNDFLQTNSINFLGTDKMTICAGVRKLSDAAIGTVAELSVDSFANSGVFWLSAPRTSAVADYGFRTAGSLISNALSSASFVAPTTNVLTGIGDISGDSAILRINGTQVASSTADQGTGNYGNYQMFLFMRAGTSLPFNGRFYGSVGRGAQSNDQQIAALEGYMNTKTAAY
jgi:hypothetical protein